MPENQARQSQYSISSTSAASAINMASPQKSAPGSTKSILKKTSQAVSAVEHLDTATNINEIGSSSSTPHPKQFLGDKEKEKRWIRANLKMKVCCSFQEDPKKIGYCMCGRSQHKEHHPDALDNPYQGKWKESLSSCVRTLPTTAYGEIEFPNANIAKFVRVSCDTDMDEVMCLLTDYWGLEKPNLLISVTGGAKNITMSKKLKDAFKKGLLKTAQTTGAWILTGGNNLGVMKYVGEAVNMIQSSRKVVAFGIAPWGCVMNKRDLTSPEGVWPAYYQMKDELPKHANLDPNHTHFILVDNGTFCKFGTEISFRGLLEKYISKMMTTNDNLTMSSATNVPVVSIVVEGGPGTLTTVKAAVDNATPVVILDGSGRAADMLAFAYNNTEEEDVITYDSTAKPVKEKIPRIPDEVKRKLKEMVEMEWPKNNADDLVSTIIHCVMRRELIVVFSLDGKNSMKDIDIAILHAIMKANKNDAMNQLKLALAWNRIDVVREEIFTDDKTWDTKELENILLTSLIQNKADFVELLMDHIHLGKFVTKKRVLELYNNVPKNHLIYKLLHSSKQSKTRKTISYCDIGAAIQTLVGDFYNPLYCRDERYVNINSDEVLGVRARRSVAPGLLQRAKSRIFSDSDSDSEEEAEISQGVGAAIGAKPLDKAKSKSQIVPTEFTAKPKRSYDFDWPARELFLWCVLMRRMDLAQHFLADEKYAIAPALVASIMLRTMQNKSYTLDSEIIAEIEVLADEFDKIAIGVLGECFTADEDKAKSLLIRVLPSYGETTLLQLAVEADNKEFVSHQACQNLLNNIWWGKMDELQGEWRLVVSVICFPLLYAVIQFRNDEELKRRRNMKIKKSKKSPMGGMQREQTILAIDGDQESGPKVVDSEETQYLTCWKKIEAFFNAPKITFIYSTVFYLVFLILFTYMMICDFHPEDVTRYSWVEVTVAVWIITLFIEELRQFWVAETNSFKLKMVSYLSDVWNLVDIGTVILFVTGFVLRIVDHEFIVRQQTLTVSEAKLEIGIDELDRWLYARPDDATITANRQSYSRVILCLALMLFWFRILHIFSVIRILGPKLVMIGRMIKDLLSFCVILVVFITSFGIAQHAIMYPNEPFEATTVWRVLRVPYWQMYGELFLDEIEGENLNTCIEQCTEDKLCLSVSEFLADFGMNRTCADGSPPTDKFGTCADGSLLGCYSGYNIPADLPLTAFPNEEIIFCYTNSSGVDIPVCESDLDRCPETNKMVALMLGVYILFTQILMFNLLIAMFSYTFTLVQENTDIHWKFQQYAMIKEYYTRPPIPPPFIIINHIFLLIRYFYRKCKHDDQFIGDDFKILMEGLTEKQLAVWERMNYEEYNRKQQGKEEESVQYKVSKTKCDVEQLLGSAEGMSNLPSLYDRVYAMEHRLNDTSEALNWIMDALSQSKMGKGKPPMLKITEDETTRQEVLDSEEKLFNEWKVKKNGMVHIKCRSSPYVKASRVRRFPVPNTKLYWEIDWPSYQPVHYTSDDILNNQLDYSDPDISKMSAGEQVKFNCQDGDVCRLSYHGAYQIDSKTGLPLNPYGRTGITGRGNLGRWGPNHALDAIVSRWKRLGNGDILLNKEKKVLEFICVKRNDVEEWSLPGTLKHDADKLMSDKNADSKAAVALAAIKEKAFGDCMSEDCKLQLESIANPQIIYEGYNDDPRNTDNAWVETLAYNFHDDTGKVTDKLELRPGERVSKVAWREASPDLILYAGHNMIVKKLIEMHDAAY